MPQNFIAHAPYDANQRRRNRQSSKIFLLRKANSAIALTLIYVAVSHSHVIQNPIMLIRALLAILPRLGNIFSELENAICRTYSKNIVIWRHFCFAHLLLPGRILFARPLPPRSIRMLPPSRALCRCGMAKLLAHLVTPILTGRRSRSTPRHRSTLQLRP